LGLTFRVYSRTILWTAPFALLLFVILPSWSSSSSPFLRGLATNTQSVLRETFTVVARASRKFYIRPMQVLLDLVVSFSSSIGGPLFGRPAGTGVGGAWAPRRSRRNLLLVSLVWCPIVEELVFRLGFRAFWKAMFKPVTVGSNSSSSNNNTNNSNNFTSITPNSPNQNNRVESKRGFKSFLAPPLSFLGETILRKRSDDLQQPKHGSSRKTWMIVSGFCFGVAHFSNLFPIDLNRYRNLFGGNGEIVLPSHSAGERFLISLFPKDFVSEQSNQEFCLVSMVLIGAIYQAMHCFINTTILYGPLLERSSLPLGSASSSSPPPRRGGILAAIGAHVAWNANVLWLVTNLQLRLLCRLVFHKNNPLLSTSREKGRASITRDDNNDGEHTTRRV